MPKWVELDDASWVVNLDGSDPRVALSTPRVEVRRSQVLWKYNALSSEKAWRTAGGYATLSAAQRAGLRALLDRVSRDHQGAISSLLQESES
jgi:hypothetical protein